MNHAAAAMGKHPSTTFLSEFFEAIFVLHVLGAEIAAAVLEVASVQRHQLTEHVVFDLANEVRESVAVHEATLARGMRMQIKIEQQTIFLAVLLHK